MNSNQIRKAFLQYFKEKDHLIVPSAPLVIHNDPSLLFTNAGMNPFKDIFLGTGKPISTKIADTQKCLRVSGKHNDLEEVGMDTYHHTFFEMLGNWSFGDYFKQDAIAMAWEVLTGVFHLQPELLYVTVFEGNAEDLVEEDLEALECWKKWIHPDKILKGNKKDNFWEMGISGPCGPCSEIHIDLRSLSERQKIPGKDLVNSGHPQVVEIWNLVFIQYNRLAGGKLIPLPQKHVDTGMGFERLCMAIQGKQSNYDTDIFLPLIQKLAEDSGQKYGEFEKVDIALRVVADHVRAIAFTVSDGVLPSNTGAGYVVRRILRRAVRYGYTYLHYRRPFLSSLIPLLCDQFKEVFPDLGNQKSFLEKVISEEEIAFLRTLELGIHRFEKYVPPLGVVEGRFAFELFDTFGFPIDLTVLMAKEKGWQVDLALFQQELEAQRLRARNAGTLTLGDWENISSKEGLVEKGELEIHSVFIGYDHLDSIARVIRFRKAEVKGEIYFHWVMNQTPFYPEGGGQVGDRGKIILGEEILEIIDTQRENNQIIHITKNFPQNLEAIHSPLRMVVDPEKRVSTSRNHSATHLLHAALKQVLGNHIAQKGSLVEPQYLRFDFSHFSKLSLEELERIESLVNQKILQNIHLDERRNVLFADAINMGSTALFGEKYGDRVRVITFDPQYSRELCGGTHITATGEIGIFEIVQETAVGSGIRRILAKTGLETQELWKERRKTLHIIGSLLKTEGNLVQALELILEENAAHTQEKEQNLLAMGKTIKQDFREGILSDWESQKSNRPANTPFQTIILDRMVSGIHSDILKTIVFELLEEFKEIPLALIIGLVWESKPFLGIGFSSYYLQNFTWKANDLVKKVSGFMEGGGGGQPSYATAGGKKREGLPLAMAQAKQTIMHS